MYVHVFASTTYSLEAESHACCTAPPALKQGPAAPQSKGNRRAWTPKARGAEGEGEGGRQVWRLKLQYKRGGKRGEPETRVTTPTNRNTHTKHKPQGKYI